MNCDRFYINYALSRNLMYFKEKEVTIQIMRYTLNTEQLKNLIIFGGNKTEKIRRKCMFKNGSLERKRIKITGLLSRMHYAD